MIEFAYLFICVVLLGLIAVFLWIIWGVLSNIYALLREFSDFHEAEPLKMFDFSAAKEKKSQNKTKKPTDRAEQWMKAREIASRR